MVSSVRCLKSFRTPGIMHLCYVCHISWLSEGDELRHLGRWLDSPEASHSMCPKSEVQDAQDYSLGHPASLHQRASPMLYVVVSRETQMGQKCPLVLELKPRCLRQAWTDIRSYSSGHTLGMSCSQASFWQLQGCTSGGGGGGGGGGLLFASRKRH